MFRPAEGSRKPAGIRKRRQLRALRGLLCLPEALSRGPDPLPAIPWSPEKSRAGDSWPLVKTGPPIAMALAASNALHVTPILQGVRSTSCYVSVVFTRIHDRVLHRSVTAGDRQRFVRRKGERGVMCVRQPRPLFHSHGEATTPKDEPNDVNDRSEIHSCIPCRPNHRWRRRG